MRVSLVVILGLEGGVNTSVQHSRTWIEYGDVGTAGVAKKNVKKTHNHDGTTKENQQSWPNNFWIEYGDVGTAWVTKQDVKKKNSQP